MTLVSEICKGMIGTGDPGEVTRADRVDNWPVRVSADDVVIGRVPDGDVADDHVSTREHVDADKIQAHIVSFDAIPAGAARPNSGTRIAAAIFRAVIGKDIHESTAIGEDAADRILITEGALHRADKSDVHTGLRVVRGNTFGNAPALEALDPMLVVVVRRALRDDAVSAGIDAIPEGALDRSAFRDHRVVSDSDIVAAILARHACADQTRVTS